MSAQDLEQRAREFASFVDSSPGLGASGECHMWTGGIQARGYGCFKRKLATHWALILSGHPRPSIKHGALHSCDEPGCVNPKHLRWGTQRENAADASERLRYANAQKTHCPQGHEYTEENTIFRARKQGWKDRHCRQCDCERKVRARAAKKVAQ